MTQLTVDPEFHALIPPLSADERTALEASLLAEGCRDALVVWNGVILDGHNRYEICLAHDIPFETVARDFETRDAAKLWIIDNQLARRNLPAYERGRLALLRATLIKTGAKLHPTLDETYRAYDSTRDQIADEADVSRGTINKIEIVERDAPAHIRDAARAGDITPNRAYNLTRALQSAPPQVADIVEKYAIDEPETVSILARLAESSKRPGSNNTFEEIALSGYIQPGEEDEAVHVTDSPLKIQAALNRKSQDHRALANHQLINQSLSPEWYTPAPYVEAARRVMGGFDLDPASNDIANKTIKATTYYTAETNGLDKEWRGRVWLNPPYGPLMPKFITRLEEHYQEGKVTEAVAVVNANSLITLWFTPLWKYIMCFPARRINFNTPDGEAYSATHGTIFVYLGPQERRFYDEFKPFGYIMKQVSYA